VSDILRTPFIYFGGKGNMIAKLKKLIPPGGQPYLEPFFGAGAVFFSRAPAPVEVINDIDDDLINVFRVMQDWNKFNVLRHRLMCTLYARAEFIRALEMMKNREGLSDIDRAWAFMVKQNFSVSGQATGAGCWGRAFVSCRGVAENANRWLMRLSMLDAFHYRLMMAQIDNRSAVEVIRYWDNEDAVIYCDPPYIMDTRKSGGYNHEMTDEQHRELVDVLLNCKGAVVLSGYEHDIYTPLIDVGWHITRFNTACSAAVRGRRSGLQGAGNALKKVPRVEVVYRNSRALQMLGELEI